ncbi:LysR family transcriptional regulator ArgP [Jiangella mangrovi]|uniref:LysR family transcriptional regulator (Chromosome initiation inhibitor) n=1 Tax=Jiangella mangrovi TaxID=1524084 RepID=A0A7W9LNB7_9ACTN|nr:LysR family transcriptional regulator ArgP [Jiangella mangrovi]MBB5789972.1 LysR family transcriptional regulator (chromosome initiation inhibitor) [Jiangella mangrovi]
MMRIDLAQLSAFAAVVEEGSFEAAARRLHVTPSAVSQRIKTLESRMGQILVTRTRPAGATPAGQVLARYAGQVRLLESEALAGLASAGAGSADGVDVRLAVAVNADSLSTWFLPALSGLASERDARFEIHQEDQDHSATLLREGAVVAAVTADPRAVQGCAVRPLGRMRYLGVATPAFAARWFPDGPTATALASATTLQFNRKDLLQTRFAREVAGRRVDPPVTVLPSSVGFADATVLGLAWAMLPESMARAPLADGRLVEFAPGRHLDVPLYWQRWKLESPLLAELTDAVVAAAGAPGQLRGALRPTAGQ